MSNKKQTAIQELIEYLNNNSLISKQVLLNKCKVLLTTEKNQIQSAFENGMIKESSSSRYISDLEAEKYYQTTFKNQ